MSLSISIDQAGLLDFINRIDRIEEINMQQEGQWYINQVYRYVSKKHGRRYTYTTPPGSERTNIRKRSGKLLRDLKEAKFSRGSNSDAQVGFNIPSGYSRNNYLGINTSVDGVLKRTRLTPSQVPNRTNRNGNNYIMIPLRAALLPDGTMKVITPRIRQGLRVVRNEDADNLNWSGEKRNKIHPNTLIMYKPSGRRGIPMYMLARRVSIPERIDLLEAFEHEIPGLVTRIGRKLDNII